MEAENVESRPRLAHEPEFTPQVSNTISPERRHHFQGLEGHPTILPTGSVNAKELVITGQGTDAHAQLISALGHVVEVGDPVGQFDWMVIRQKVPERTESNALGPLERLGY